MMLTISRCSARCAADLGLASPYLGLPPADFWKCASAMFMSLPAAALLRVRLAVLCDFLPSCCQFWAVGLCLGRCVPEQAALPPPLCAPTLFSPRSSPVAALSSYPGPVVPCCPFFLLALLSPLRQLGRCRLRAVPSPCLRG